MLQDQQQLLNLTLSAMPEHVCSMHGAQAVALCASTPGLTHSAAITLDVAEDFASWLNQTVEDDFALDLLR